MKLENTFISVPVLFSHSTQVMNRIIKGAAQTIVDALTTYEYPYLHALITELQDFDSHGELIAVYYDETLPDNHWLDGIDFKCVSELEPVHEKLLFLLEPNLVSENSDVLIEEVVSKLKPFCGVQPDDDTIGDCKFTTESYLKSIGVDVN